MWQVDNLKDYPIIMLWYPFPLFTLFNKSYLLSIVSYIVEKAPLPLGKEYVSEIPSQAFIPFPEEKI